MQSAWCVADGGCGTFVIRYQPSNGIPGTLIANKKTMQRGDSPIQRSTDSTYRNGKYVLNNRLGTLFLWVCAKAKLPAAAMMPFTVLANSPYAYVAIIF